MRRGTAPASVQGTALPRPISHCRRAREAAAALPSHRWGGSGAGSRGRAGPRRGPLLVATASGTVLNPLNSSLIAVALIQLAEDFELLFACVSWMISLFHLTSAVAQPVSGRLGDVFGPRRLFLAGLALVGLASPRRRSPPNFATLLAIRAVQALGSSAIYPLRHGDHPPAGRGGPGPRAGRRSARRWGGRAGRGSPSTVTGPSARAATGGRNRSTVPASPASTVTGPLSVPGATSQSLPSTSSMPTQSAPRPAAMRSVSRALRGCTSRLGPSASAASTSARAVSDFDPGRDTTASTGAGWCGAGQTSLTRSVCPPAPHLPARAQPACGFSVFLTGTVRSRRRLANSNMASSESSRP